MRNSSLAAVVLVLLPALLSAQFTRVVPAGTTHEEGNALSFFPFVLQGGRVQQVTGAREVAFNSAVIRQMAFRRDTQNTGAFGARSFSTFNVTLGHTSVTPATMSTTFATNRGVNMTQVFSSSFNAPAQPVVPGPAPFNIIIKFTAPFVFTVATGNLVWEIEIPGTTNRRVAYFIDGQIDTSGGSARAFGKGGPFSGNDAYSLKSDESKLLPGGQATLTAAGLKNPYLTVAIYGFSNKQYGPFQLPLDLNGAGAPGNHLYVSMDIFGVMTLAQQGGTWGGSVALPLPSINLTGLALFGQALFHHQPSNALGWVFSNGVEMIVGSTDRVPCRAVGAYASSLLSGSFAVRSSSSTLAGGIVVQFEGAIN